MGHGLLGPLTQLCGGASDHATRTSRNFTEHMANKIQQHYLAEGKFDTSNSLLDNMGPTILLPVSHVPVKVPWVPPALHRRQARLDRIRPRSSSSRSSSPSWQPSTSGSHCWWTPFSACLGLSPHHLRGSEYTHELIYCFNNIANKKTKHSVVYTEAAEAAFKDMEKEIILSLTNNLSGLIIY